MIPFFKPSFGPEEESAAIRVLKSGHLTQGPEVAAFEEEFAALLNAPYVIAVDNCTNALFLSLQYLKEKTGPQTIGCPAMTFASVANVIKQTGHQLEFLDEYYAGDAYRLGNTNIWDCAHRIERGMYKSGQTMCFSFYPNKILGSAEGGAIATDDKEFAEWCRLARNNGRDSQGFDYTIQFSGWKMNMTDLQAAIAREQLKILDNINNRRAAIKLEYDKYLLPINDWHYLYVILVQDRERFMKGMLEDGIETSYHFKPLYDQPAFQVTGNFPFTETVKSHLVTLPLYPTMTDEEVQTVIKLTLKHLYE